jgi:hypothetical protein
MAAGCGAIADKERIVIATLDGAPITRGDLFEVIRNMDDAARPNIRNRGDLLRVLNAYIDRQVKKPLGKELDEKLPEEQKEQLMAQAREQVFLENEDKNYRQVYAMEPPADGKATPAMESYNITVNGLLNMKALIDDMAEVRYEINLGDYAVDLRAVEAFRAGEIAATPDELRNEYTFRKEEFQTFEWMEFQAIRFPASDDGAAAAAQLRQKLAAGAPFEEAFNEALQEDPQKVLISEIENNPTLTRFQSFWRNASGAKKGEIVGPVFLPAYTQQVQMKSGEVANVQMPDAFLVLEVLDHRPARIMTIEEAQNQLLPPILHVKMLERLREERGVEIYPDQLPDVTALAE